MHPGKMNSLTKVDAIGNSIMYKTFTTKITLLNEVKVRKKCKSKKKYLAEITENSIINWKEPNEFPVLLSNQ